MVVFESFSGHLIGSQTQNHAHRSTQLELHPRTHVSGKVARYFFLAAPDTTGCLNSLTGRFSQMMRIFGVRFMLTSAQRAWQPFAPRRAGPSQFAGVWDANLQWVGVASQPGSVSLSAATALHVSVSEAELLNIAKTKDCTLPGVHFNRKRRYWCIRWFQNKKGCGASISVGRFEKLGMTEDAASLTALRAAIAKRNEKVASIVTEEKLNFDEGDL